jgi:hypothetical protein
VRSDHGITPEMSVSFPSLSFLFLKIWQQLPSLSISLFLFLSLWMWPCGNEERHSLIMENGEEREGEIQLAETDFGCKSGSGTVLEVMTS